jgi:hypothetical protein
MGFDLAGPVGAQFPDSLLGMQILCVHSRANFFARNSFTGPARAQAHAMSISSHSGLKQHQIAPRRRPLLQGRRHTPIDHDEADAQPGN